ncbi:hypothetical protein D3C80_1182460 [compost metagenome]
MPEQHAGTDDNRQHEKQHHLAQTIDQVARHLGETGDVQAHHPFLLVLCAELF